MIVSYQEINSFTLSDIRFVIQKLIKENFFLFCVSFLFSLQEIEFNTNTTKAENFNQRIEKLLYWQGNTMRAWTSARIYKSERNRKSSIRSLVNV